MSWITTKTIEEKKAEVRNLLEQSADLLKNGETEKVDELHAKVENAKKEIDRLENQANNEKSFAAKIDLSKKDEKRYSLHKVICQLAEGRQVDGLEKEISDEIARKSGKTAQGCFFPTTLRNSETLVTGTGTIQTDVLSGSFIELMRSKMLASQLGVQFIGDLVGPVAIPKQTGASQAYWVDPATGDAITISAATTTSVPMTASTCGAYSEIPRSFLKQSSLDAEVWTRDELAKTVAQEIDRVIFNGSGSGAEPEGILQNSSVSLVSLGATDGGVPTWAKIVEMESNVETYNFDTSTAAYVTTPAGKGKLKTTLKAASTAVYLWENDLVNGYHAYATNQLPSNLTEGSGSGVNLSSMIFGDFSQIVVGQWGAVDITVNPFIKDTQGIVRVVALQDLDVALRNAKAFSKVVDMLTA